MRQHIRRIFQDLSCLLRDTEELFADRIARVVEHSARKIGQGGTIYLMGNGGSAADAIHWAGELMGRFKQNRPGIPAFALNSNPSVMTAVANDYDYSEVFARQTAAVVRETDVVFALSTSGGSANILNALSAISTGGSFKVGFCGQDGGRMAPLVDVLFDVPSSDTPRIQEIHELLGHIICELLEDRLFGDTKSP